MNEALQLAQSLKAGTIARYSSNVEQMDPKSSSPLDDAKLEALIREAKLDAIEETLALLTNQVGPASLHEVGPRAMTLLHVMERDRRFNGEWRFESIRALADFLGAGRSSVRGRVVDYREWLEGIKDTKSKPEKITS